MSESRIASIDIMRGLTLLLMLFVNDLNMTVAPAWLGHMEADFDGMGLADWVFPGFLFMVGLAIPFALSKRLSNGEPVRTISKHILARSVSLIVIGVMMLNSGRVNPELTGMSTNLWALLMYIAVFFYWNDYRDKENRFFTVMGFKILALAIFVLLVFKFRSGQPENNGSIITSWWGILGLIGWAYLVSAFTYLLCRDSVVKTAIVTLFFLGMNILSGLGLLDYLNPVKPILGVIIDGSNPLIVLTGLLGGILLKKYSKESSMKVILIYSGLGLLCISLGFILRHWFILSKIKATPSWGLLCSGISYLVFSIIYWISDVKNWRSWALFFKPAGENSLTTYIAPDILYYLIWMSGISIQFYKNSHQPLVVISGSIVWAILMVGLTALLARFNIRLRI